MLKLCPFIKFEKTVNFHIIVSQSFIGQNCPSFL